MTQQDANRMYEASKSVMYVDTSDQREVLKKIEASKICIVTGRPGCGMTTMLVNRKMAHKPVDANEVYIAHYVGITTADRTVNGIMWAVASQIREILDDQINLSDFAEEIDPMTRFHKALLMFGVCDRRATVVIDGIDAVVDADQGKLDWLIWPQHMRICRDLVKLVVSVAANVGDKWYAAINKERERKAVDIHTFGGAFDDEAKAELCDAIYAERRVWQPDFIGNTISSEIRILGSPNTADALMLKLAVAVAAEEKPVEHETKRARVGEEGDEEADLDEDDSDLQIALASSYAAPAIAELLVRHVSRYDAVVGHLLSCLAICDLGLSSSELQTLAENMPGGVEQWHEFVATPLGRFVLFQGRRVLFTHNVVRQAVIWDIVNVLTNAQRVSLHRKVASALSETEGAFGEVIRQHIAAADMSALLGWVVGYHRVSRLDGDSSACQNARFHLLCAWKVLLAADASRSPEAAYTTELRLIGLSRVPTLTIQREQHQTVRFLRVVRDLVVDLRFRHNIQRPDTRHPENTHFFAGLVILYSDDFAAGDKALTAGWHLPASSPSSSTTAAPAPLAELHNMSNTAPAPVEESPLPPMRNQQTTPPKRVLSDRDLCVLDLINIPPRLSVVVRGGAVFIDGLDVRDLLALAHFYADNAQPAEVVDILTLLGCNLVHKFVGDIGDRIIMHKSLAKVLYFRGLGDGSSSLAALPSYRFEKALELTRQFFGPNHVDIGLLHEVLIKDYEQRRMSKQALQHCDEVLQMWHKYYAEPHVSIAAVYIARSVSYHHLAQYETSLAHINTAIAMVRQLGRRYHGILGICCNNKGNIHAAMERYDEAMASFVEARALFESTGSLHTVTGVALQMSVASMYAVTGRQADALALYMDLAKVQREKFPHHALHIAHTLNNAGLMLVELVRYNEAMEMFMEAFAVLRPVPNLPPAGLFSVFNNVAILFSKRREHRSALIIFDLAICLAATSYNPDHPQLGAVYNNMAAILYESGKYGAARDFALRAVKIRKAKFGDDSPHTKCSIDWLTRITNKLPADAPPPADPDLTSTPSVISLLPALDIGRTLTSTNPAARVLASILEFGNRYVPASRPR